MVSLPIRFFAIAVPALLFAILVAVLGARPAGAQVSVGMPAFVRLQATTGTAQIGHSNITGTSTAGQFVGDGAGLTGLNATNLATGSVSPNRIQGAYPGISGVGNVVSGTWHASIIDPIRGGTGLNTGSVSAGCMLYTSAIGTWNIRAIGSPGTVLGSDGSLPNWVPDGLSLPYSGFINTASDAFTVSQQGSGDCLRAAINDLTSFADAVNATTIGTGTALSGFTSGTGYAGRFSNSTTGDQVDVAGVTGAVNLNSGYLYREYTASTRSAAIPIAYGSVSPTGVVNGGTGNFTVTHTVAGEYDITITGETFNSNTFTANANVLANTTPYVATIADIGTPFRVSTWNLTSNAKSDATFHFVVWKASATGLGPDSEPGPDYGGSGIRVMPRRRQGP